MQKKRILRLCCAVLMVSLSACEYEDDFPAGVGEGNIEAIVLNEGRIWELYLYCTVTGW